MVYMVYHSGFRFASARKTASQLFVHQLAGVTHRAATAARPYPGQLTGPILDSIVGYGS